MANFKYIALTKHDKEEVGIVEALNRESAMQALYTRGLFVTSLSLSKEDKITNYKFKKSDMGDFCRQMGSMLSSGIPLIKALNLLRNRDMPEKIRNIYNRIYKNLLQGLSLSASLSDCGSSFDTMLINMVIAGESSGRLDSTMNKLAVYYDRESRMQSKVHSAMVYPCLLAVLTLVIVIIMFTLILPQFFKTFEGMDLPLITIILMSVSNFIVTHILSIFIFLVLVFVLVYVLLSNSKVRIKLDKFKLNMPIIGSLSKIIYTSRFSRTLSSLYSSGLAMLPALQIAIKTVDSPYIESQFSNVIKDVKRGVALSKSLKEVFGFDSKLSDTVFIGEESGNLDELLISASENYDYEADMATSRLISLIEPLMIILMAFFVGIIALAVMLPIMNIYKNIG